MVTHLREDRDLQRLEELELAHNTVAAAPLALTARAFTKPELVHDNRVAPLQDLDVADTCVRDVGMHAGRPMPSWTRA